MIDTISVGMVSYYSTDFLTRLIDSIKKNTLESNLKFIICDNTNGQDQQLYDTLNSECVILPFAPKNPRRRSNERASGSFVHGLGLNFLLSNISTEYCLFIDPDCLILAKGWDIACKKAINSRCIAIGAPYHSRKIIKYQDFPSPIFIFFKPDKFTEIEADWTPYTDSTFFYTYDQLIRIVAISASRLGEFMFGQEFYLSRVAQGMRRLFGNSSKDTGWKNQYKAQSYGYSASLFTSSVSVNQLKPIFRKNIGMETFVKDYELFLWLDVPILTHFYGTKHKHKENKTETILRWRQLSETLAPQCSYLEA